MGHAAYELNYQQCPNIGLSGNNSVQEWVVHWADAKAQFIEKPVAQHAIIAHNAKDLKKSFTFKVIKTLPLEPYLN